MSSALDAFTRAGLTVHDHSAANTLITDNGQLRIIDFALPVEEDDNEDEDEEIVDEEIVSEEIVSEDHTYN